MQRPASESDVEGSGSPLPKAKDHSETVDVLKQIDEQLFLLTNSPSAILKNVGASAHREQGLDEPPSKLPASDEIPKAHLPSVSSFSTPSKRAQDTSMLVMEQQVVSDAENIFEELQIREKLAHRACLSGNASALNFSLSFTAQVPSLHGESVMSPLHEAAAFGSVSILSFLLYGLKVDVNLTTSKGNSALHVACFEGNLDAAEFLLSAGGSVTATNCWGQTAFDIAHEDVLVALRGNGPPCITRAAARLVVSKACFTLGLGAEASLDDAKHKFRALAGKVRANMIQETAPKSGARSKEVLEGLCRAYEIVKRREDASLVLAYAAQPCLPAWAETYQSLELRGAEHAADWMVQNHLDVETLEDLSEDAQLSALLDLGMPQEEAEVVCARLRGVQKGGRSAMEEWLRQRSLGKLAPLLEASGIGSISRLREASAEELQTCVRLVGPRRKLMEAIRKDLQGALTSHTREFSGAVATRGAEPGSIVVKSGSVSMELGSQGQLRALQGGERPPPAAGGGAAALPRRGQGRGEGARMDEGSLATVAQLVGSVKRETALGEELRRREVQWRRRGEVLERAAREAEERAAVLSAGNAGLVASLEKRSRASADKFGEKELECAKLTDQVGSLTEQVQVLKRLAGYAAADEESTGSKVLNRQLQVEVLDLRTALANARKDLTLERSVTSSLQERLDALSGDLESERGRRKAAEEARAEADASLVRLERLEEDRKQWAAQVEQLMADLYQASIAEQRVKLALERLPAESVAAAAQLREAADDNRRLQAELATARIVEQRYWADFLAEPSLAQIEAAARAASEEPPASPRALDGTGEGASLVEEAAEVQGTLLFASELSQGSAPGSAEKAGAGEERERETSEHYSSVSIAAQRARSADDDADFEQSEGRRTVLTTRGNAAWSSASDSDDDDAALRERASPSRPLRGAARRAGDGRMRGALQRAQKHVLGVWSGSPKGPG